MRNQIVCYVHGAGASPRSFAFMKSIFPEHDAMDVHYSISEPIEVVVQRCVEGLPDAPIVMVGHSLGGIVALEAARRSSRIQKVATLCTPFGGSAVADIMRWINPSPLFDVLRPSGPIMTNMRTKPLPCPVFGIVGTAGLPIMHQENDGVVTVEAQTALRNATFKHYNLNHFEVLMDNEVAADIWNVIASTDFG